MPDRLRAFGKSQRSAVAMIFALSFIPLIYLVGLSVDYTFYSLAANQALLAAQGAATNAVRAAVSTYTLETNAGVSGSTGTPNAWSDGQTAGEQAGYMWFIAQLGSLPRGSISYTGTPNSGGSAVTASGYPDVSITAPANGGGYIAKVSYALTYPPLFNGLFGHATNWVATGNTQATSNFDYAEILFMLDASNSMLIGTSTNDELSLEYNSVCQASPVWDTSTALGHGALSKSPTWSGTAYAANSYITSGDYTFRPADNDMVDFRYVANYSDPSNKSSDTSGTCNVTSPINSGNPSVPCALACHSSSNTIADPAYTGDKTLYPEDLYGEARRIRMGELHSNPPSWSGSSTTNPYGTNTSPYGASPALSLRLDIVMDSANTAINDMETAEAFNGQFTAGVYYFSLNTTAIATGNSTSGTPEAASLPTAASEVLADDYIQTPGETAFPPYYDSGTRNTDFVTSMANLLKGYNPAVYSGSTLVTPQINITYNGTAISSTTTSQTTTPGATASNPLKFLFIITDGLEDVIPSGGSNTTFGEMTSYKAENGGGSNAAVCLPYKQKGFTIYVLAIEYYPIASINYYNDINYPTIYTTDDYPNPDGFSSSDETSPQELTYSALTGNSNFPPNPNNLPPVQVGLQACASSENDFYTATDANSISTAIDTMLRSALASTIRLSN